MDTKYSRVALKKLRLMFENTGCLEVISECSKRNCPLYKPQEGSHPCKLTQVIPIHKCGNREQFSDEELRYIQDILDNHGISV